LSAGGPHAAAAILVAIFERAFVIVLDSVGIGELPDAAQYGDQGSDTLGNVSRQAALRLPTLESLGLGNIASLPGIPPADAPRGAFGRMAEASPGKDSVTGHWEIAGLVLDRPFPTFPEGFPSSLIETFEARIGRGTLGNEAASGTEIISRLGAVHMVTGRPIVYTSADSVFQIAAHEDVIPVPDLYRMCEVAYELTVEGLGLGRVIARPFRGEPGAFVRTAHRHDYAMPPPVETLLDRLTAGGVPVIAIGKIADLFARRGISRAVATPSDEAGMDAVGSAMRDESFGLVFANLVDFDTLYGHRNDVAGYARNLERFDDRLSYLLPKLQENDLLVVTADHGNDPTTPSTDHSREFVPLVVTGPRVTRGVDLGTRSTFADLGQTLAANFGVPALAHGLSFLQALCL
jgi:phosphopentomutase